MPSPWSIAMETAPSASQSSKLSFARCWAKILRPTLSRFVRKGKKEGFLFFKKRLQRIFALCDSDGNGSIELSEFLDVMSEWLGGDELEKRRKVGNQFISSLSSVSEVVGQLVGCRGARGSAQEHQVLVLFSLLLI